MLGLALNPVRILTALSGLVVVAAAAFGVWSLTSTMKERGRAEERLVWQARQAKLESAHRTREHELLGQIQHAEELHEQRLQDQQQADARARTELDRLRGVLAQRDRELAARDDRRQADPAPVTGPPADATALERELFGQCAAELVDLAGQADAMRLQLIGLQDYVNLVIKENR